LNHTCSSNIRLWRYNYILNNVKREREREREGGNYEGDIFPHRFLILEWTKMHDLISNLEKFDEPNPSKEQKRHLMKKVSDNEHMKRMTSVQKII